MKNLAGQPEKIKKQISDINIRLHALDREVKPRLLSLLNYAEEARDSDLEGFCYARLAAYYYLNTNDTETFHRMLRRAFELTAAVGDDEEIAYTCNLMAIDYSNNGNYPQALNSYLTGIRHVPDNSGMQANIYGNTGGVYWRLGNYQKAISYSQKAFDIITHLGSETNWFNALIFLCQIAFCEVRAGQLEQAGATLEQINRLM